MSERVGNGDFFNALVLMLLTIMLFLLKFFNFDAKLAPNLMQIFH